MQNIKFDNCPYISHCHAISNSNKKRQSVIESANNQSVSVTSMCTNASLIPFSLMTFRKDKLTFAAQYCW